MHVRVFLVGPPGLILLCLGQGVHAAERSPPTVPAAVKRSAPAPSDLKAILAGPVEVELRWKSKGTEALAAYLIEFTTKPPGPYTVVAAVPPEQNTFRHARLAPETRFVYRVRGLYGLPSNVVEVVTGTRPETLPPHTPLRGPRPMMPPNDDVLAAARPRVSVERSVRNPATAASAAPTQLTAALATPIHVVLQWKDNAQDEEGYLLEASKDPTIGFSLIGLFPPDTTEFEIPDPLPAETKMYYRVRAYFSRASNRVAQQTSRSPK